MTLSLAWCALFFLSRSYSVYLVLLCVLGLCVSVLHLNCELSFDYWAVDFGFMEASLMIDDLGMWFAGLTVLCFSWLIVSMYTKHSMTRSVDILIVYLFLCALLFFLCGDLLVLYTSFELTTLPIILFVSMLGVSSSRVYALSVMIVYMLGSSALLAIILFLYLDELQSAQHMYVAILRNTYGSDQWMFVLFILIFFAVNVPVFPFYVWLPEAHVESNTEISILLASIVLNFGAFGLLRLGYWLDVDHVHSIGWFAVAVCIVGLVHSCASSIVHLDLKKLIAYSSIAHMQFSLIGVFVNDTFGLSVAVLGLLIHGIVSIGLFYTIGMVSESVGTRHVAFVHCGVSLTPMLSLVGFATVLLNIATPLSLGAIVEILTLTLYGNFGATILIITAMCAVWGCCLFSLILLYRAFMSDASWWSVDTVDLTVTEVYVVSISYSILAVAVWIV